MPEHNKWFRNPFPSGPEFTYTQGTFPIIQDGQTVMVWDLNTLDPDVLRAVLWYKLAYPQLFPKRSDWHVKTFGLFLSPLGVNWQTVMEFWRAAGSPPIDIYVTEDEVRAHCFEHGISFEPEPMSIAAPRHVAPFTPRRLPVLNSPLGDKLWEAAEAYQIRGGQIIDGLVKGVKATGGTVHFNDALLIGDVTGEACTITGHVTTLRGINMYATSGNCAPNITYVELPQLYFMAQMRGHVR